MCVHIYIYVCVCVCMYVYMFRLHNVQYIIHGIWHIVHDIQYVRMQPTMVSGILVFLGEIEPERRILVFM